MTSPRQNESDVTDIHSRERFREEFRDEAAVEVVRETVIELEQITERLRSFLKGIEDQ